MKNDFKEGSRIIEKIAFSWSRKTGLHVEDLISEGNLCYAHCIKTHNPEIGPFKNYLRKCVLNSIKNYVHKEMNHPPFETQWRIAESNRLFKSNENPETVCSFKMGLEKLSEETKEVVKLVFDMPTELVEMARGSYITAVSKHTIRKFLQSKGWGAVSINHCFAEIREAL